MSAQLQHPAVMILWNEIFPLLRAVPTECIGLKGPQFKLVERNVAILNVLITTGELPPGIEMRPTDAEAVKPADNGKSRAGAPVPSTKGPRGDRQKRRLEAKVGGKGKQSK